MFQKLIAAKVDVHKKEEMVIFQYSEHADCSKELMLTKHKIWHYSFDTVHSKNADSVKELLKAGAEFNLTNNARDTAFIFAHLHGHVDCVKELNAAGVDVNVTMMID